MAILYEFNNRFKSNKEFAENKKTVPVSSNNFPAVTVLETEKRILNENNYVLKEIKRKKADVFVDITYVCDKEKILVGRYVLIEDKIDIDVNDKYIIVYNWKFDREKGKVLINNILSLYDIEDKTEIVGTFKELGTIFNNYKKAKYDFIENNSTKLNYRTDVERKTRKIMH